MKKWFDFAFLVFENMLGNERTEELDDKIKCGTIFIFLHACTTSITSNVKVQLHKNAITDLDRLIFNRWLKLFYFLKFKPFEIVFFTE